LAVLRHRTFFSLAELNAAIAELLVKLNEREMRIGAAIIDDRSAHGVVTGGNRSARWDLRITPGSEEPVISRASVSFEGGRVYTVGARGDITAESDADPGWPFLDNTANR
jgi:hypothetical protein